MTETRSTRARRVGAGIAAMVFPLLLIAGYLLHPDLLSLERATTATDLVDDFRGNLAFHAGHLLVLAAAPLILATVVHLMPAGTGSRARWTTAGGLAAGFGAIVLAVDKGAMTLTLTAFDTLADGQLADAAPALQTLLDRAGWLWLLWLLVLLPLGAAVQTVGLYRSRLVPRWQAAAMAVGALLLASPDIEAVSVVGALLVAVGYVPLGWRLVVGPLVASLPRQPARLLGRPAVVRVPRARPHVPTR